MDLFNTDYDVYSHSYLCYGQDQMRLIYQGELVQQANGSILVDDPCLQVGYNQTLTYGKISSTACAIQRYMTPANFTTATNVTFRLISLGFECTIIFFILEELVIIQNVKH
jgi:hypothetical protein